MVNGVAGVAACVMLIFPELVFMAVKAVANVFTVMPVADAMSNSVVA
jgi:hypothetical protein